MTHQLPAGGGEGEAPASDRALIPADCWEAAWHSATATVGAVALVAVLLIGLFASEPWGAWLLNHSTFGAHL